MAIIEMNVDKFDHGGWYAAGTQRFERVSHWLKIRHNYRPTKSHLLWNYVVDGYGYKPHQDDFDPERGLFLDYFVYNGRPYAIEQFINLLNPFFMGLVYSWKDKYGEYHQLSGIDGENLFHPIYIEVDECAEYVRIYRMISWFE